MNDVTIENGVFVASQDGLNKHTENTTVHITEEERSSWNAASDIPRAFNVFTGNNSHTGVETFNGKVIFKAPALSTGRDTTRNALATNETALLMSYVHMIDSANCLTGAINISGRNASAYMGCSIDAPNNAGESVAVFSGWNQDELHTCYRYRVDFVNGTAIHFGSSCLAPDGVWQADRPYMLKEGGNNNWKNYIFCVVGRNYHGNALPYLIFYSPLEQEIAYAEIIGQSYKTFSVHCRSWVNGVLDETIYSGCYPYNPAKPSSFFARTEITTKNNPKRHRISGCRVFGTTSNFNRTLNYRVYVPPVYSYDPVIADTYAQEVHALMEQPGYERQFTVTSQNGEPLPDSVKFPATGGSVEVNISTGEVKSRHCRVYVQPLDSWVTSNLSIDGFVEFNSTEKVTLTVAANDTDQERKTWVLIGQYDGPARILKVIQETDAQQE